jgi:hypothetical protein
MRMLQRLSLSVSILLQKYCFSFILQIFCPFFFLFDFISCLPLGGCVTRHCRHRDGSIFCGLRSLLTGERLFAYRRKAFCLQAKGLLPVSENPERACFVPQNKSRCTAKEPPLYRRTKPFTAFATQLWARVTVRITIFKYCPSRPVRVPLQPTTGTQVSHLRQPRVRHPRTSAKR